MASESPPEALFSVAGRTAEFAELRRQLDAADADIVLVNKWLDEAHGMYFLVVNKY